MTYDGDLPSLESFRLFHGLTPEELDHLRADLRRLERPPGTSLVRAEDMGRVVYVLVEGTVKVHRVQPDGNEVILAFLGPGDTIGEMSLVDYSGHSADVVTMEDSTLLSMSHTRFQHHLSAVPRLAQNLAQLLSERLRQANALILALASLDVAGRISRQLLAFGERYGRREDPGVVVIPLRLTQSDLASMVGASRERVNQVMMKLKGAGLVSVDPHHRITLHDPQGLAGLCE